MDTYALPRFGPGAWLQLLEMLYTRASGRELRVLRHGKPNPPAYTCAAHKLARQLGAGARALQHIYAIGCGQRGSCVVYGFCALCFWFRPTGRRRARAAAHLRHCVPRFVQIGAIRRRWQPGDILQQLATACRACVLLSAVLGAAVQGQPGQRRARGQRGGRALVQRARAHRGVPRYWQRRRCARVSWLKCAALHGARLLGFAGAAGGHPRIYLCNVLAKLSQPRQ